MRLLFGFNLKDLVSHVGFVMVAFPVGLAIPEPCICSRRFKFSLQVCCFATERSVKIAKVFFGKDELFCSLLSSCAGRLLRRNMCVFIFFGV